MVKALLLYHEDWSLDSSTHVGKLRNAWKGSSQESDTLCGGPNEDGPHSSISLNFWFPVSETVWEGPGGVALLEEVNHWGVLRGFKSSNNSQVALSLSHVCRSSCKFSVTAPAACLPACYCVPCHDGHELTL